MNSGASNNHRLYHLNDWKTKHTIFGGSYEIVVHSFEAIDGLILIDGGLVNVWQGLCLMMHWIVLLVQYSLQENNKHLINQWINQWRNG